MAPETETTRADERAATELQALEQRVQELGRRLLAADAQLARMAEQEVELRERDIAAVELAREHAQAVLVLEHERDEARTLLERARGVHAGMVGSPSWRITAPLRALKSGLRQRS